MKHIEKIILYFLLAMFLAVILSWNQKSRKQVEIPKFNENIEILRWVEEKKIEGVPIPYKKRICASNSACKALSEALVYEARGEPREGAEMVARVIIERSRNPYRWADTIEGVIAEPHQFSFLRDKHQQTPPTQQDWNRAKVIAYDVLIGESRYLEESRENNYKESRQNNNDSERKNRGFSKNRSETTTDELLDVVPDHYHAKSVRPHWANVYRHLFDIGEHSFYSSQ